MSSDEARVTGDKAFNFNFLNSIFYAASFNCYFYVDNIVHLCNLCWCHHPHQALTEDSLPTRCAPEVDNNNNISGSGNTLHGHWSK